MRDTHNNITVHKIGFRNRRPSDMLRARFIFGDHDRFE
jgi:hypothetical protein